MKKKHKTILFIAALFVLVWAASSHVRIRNVFDQLYHTRQSAFGGMRSTRWHRPFPELGEASVQHQGRMPFLLEHTDGRIEIIFFFPIENSDEVIIRVILHFPENEEIILYYTYRRQRKTLHVPAMIVSSPLYDRGRYPVFPPNPDIVDDFLARHGLVRAEIEELHHGFLFEYFLPLWYETTRTTTRFSPDNWGEFTIVDERTMPE